MILSTLKTYGIAIAGGVIAVLLIAVRVLTGQNSKLRVKAETAQARANHARVVLKKDKEVELEHDVRTEQLEQEIEEKKASSELSDPNERW